MNCQCEVLLFLYIIFVFLFGCALGFIIGLKWMAKQIGIIHDFAVMKREKAKRRIDKNMKSRR